MTRRPLLVLLALTGALSGCSAGSSDDDPSASAGGSPGASTGASAGADGPADGPAVKAVRAAPDSSVAAGSSRFDLTSRTEVGGAPLVVEGDGLFDYAGREGALSLQLPGGTVEQRVVGGTVYLALSQQPGAFYELTLQEVQGTALGGSTDPAASFAALRASNDDVREVGSEQVRGTATTRYEGTIDVRRAVEGTQGSARQLAEATLGRSGLDVLPFSAWLDDDGRLRRYVQELPVQAGEATGGQPVTTTTTVELYDFGVAVAVDPPPPGQVRDGAPLLAALQGRPPAGPS